MDHAEREIVRQVKLISDVLLHNADHKLIHLIGKAETAIHEFVRNAKPLEDKATQHTHAEFSTLLSTSRLTEAMAAIRCIFTPTHPIVPMIDAYTRAVQQWQTPEKEGK